MSHRPCGSPDARIPDIVLPKSFDRAQTEMGSLLATILLSQEQSCLMPKWRESSLSFSNAIDSAFNLFETSNRFSHDSGCCSDLTCFVGARMPSSKELTAA